MIASSSHRLMSRYSLIILLRYTFIAFFLFIWCFVDWRLAVVRQCIVFFDARKFRHYHTELSMYPLMLLATQAMISWVLSSVLLSVIICSLECHHVLSIVWEEQDKKMLCDTNKVLCDRNKTRRSDNGLSLLTHQTMGCLFSRIRQWVVSSHATKIK